MTIVETTCEIHVPPEDLWAFITDLERIPEWVVFTDEMLEITHPEETGQVGEGSTYREIGGPGPVQDESSWHITEFQPPHRQVHEGDLGAMQFTLTMKVEPAQQGSLLTHRVDLHVLDGFRPLGWLLEKLVVQHIMRRGLGRTQANAKRIVEAEAMREQGSRDDAQASARET